MPAGLLAYCLVCAESLRARMVAQCLPTYDISLLSEFDLHEDEEVTEPHLVY